MAPHIHDRIDYTAEVFVVYKNTVLLRKHDKYGIWLSVGGHIELDEDPNEAAIREVKEEVGLDVILWDPRTVNNSDDTYTELIPPVSVGRHVAAHGTRPDHEHVTFVYFASCTSGEVTVRYDGDRSDEWRWVSKEELNTLELRPNVRHYATRALEVLGS